MRRQIDAPFVEKGRNGLRSFAGNVALLSWVGARETLRMVSLFIVSFAKLAPLVMLLGSISSAAKSYQYWSNGKMFGAVMALLMIPAILAVGAAVMRLHNVLRWWGRQWL